MARIARWDILAGNYRGL